MKDVQLYINVYNDFH